MAASKSPFVLRVVMKTVRNLFPKVRQLDTDVLDHWIKDEDTTDYVLLDVREKEEYKVSHLPEALFIQPETSGKEVMSKVTETAIGKGLYRSNVNVITYCSVGMRASKMAQRIEEELEARKDVERDEKISVNVYNLEGAIFKWTNEGRPLVDKEEKETIYCHPFSTFWGLIIPPHTRKYKA